MVRRAVGAVDVDSPKGTLIQQWPRSYEPPPDSVTLQGDRLVIATGGKWNWTSGPEMEPRVVLQTFAALSASEVLPFVRQYGFPATQPGQAVPATRFLVCDEQGRHRYASPDFIEGGTEEGNGTIWWQRQLSSSVLSGSRVSATVVPLAAVLDYAAWVSAVIRVSDWLGSTESGDRPSPEVVRAATTIGAVCSAGESFRIGDDDHELPTRYVLSEDPESAMADRWANLEGRIELSKGLSFVLDEAFERMAVAVVFGFVSGADGQLRGQLRLTGNGLLGRLMANLMLCLGLGGGQMTVVRCEACDELILNPALPPSKGGSWRKAWCERCRDQQLTRNQKNSRASLRRRAEGLEGSPEEQQRALADRTQRLSSQAAQKKEKRRAKAREAKQGSGTS